MGRPATPPLTGYRVAVTSARRSDELCALLRRHGAAVSHAAAISMVALPDDDELRPTLWSPRPASDFATGSPPPTDGNWPAS
jgi:hypothetical protein